MTLYLVHCGYYDRSLGFGIYEAHCDFFVVADSFDAAKTAAKALPEFQQRKMHVDGVVEVEAVAGRRVTLVEDAGLAGATRVRRAGQSWEDLNG